MKFLTEGITNQPEGELEFKTPREPSSNNFDVFLRCITQSGNGGTEGRIPEQTVYRSLPTE